ncbi:MAG: hypothetical protein AAFY73_03880 [Pseudomonadota bacterium]
MANIFLVGITSASLSFMAVVGLSSLTFDQSHAQGAETASSVAATVSPQALPELERVEQTTAPRVDETLRAFAVDRLHEQLGAGLRDGVSADDDALPLAQRPSHAESAPSFQKPSQRLPRII